MVESMSLSLGSRQTGFAGRLFCDPPDIIFADATTGFVNHYSLCRQDERLHLLSSKIRKFLFQR